MFGPSNLPWSKHCEQYRVKGTNYEVPQCAVYSRFVTSSLSLPDTFLSIIFSLRNSFTLFKIMKVQQDTIMPCHKPSVDVGYKLLKNFTVLQAIPRRLNKRMCENRCRTKTHWLRNNMLPISLFIVNKTV